MYSTVIITGASSGFGKGFAERLAPHCRRMILIARRESVLQKMATAIHTQHGTTVDVWPCDLADSQARAALLTKLCTVTDKSILLINNAGLGDYGEFCTAEQERNRALIEVNMTAPVELTRAMLPAMLQADKAGIINIASLAADLAIPDFAMYAASKAFVASFSEALRIELNKTNIHVTAVCPGPVHTGFGDVARRTGKSKKEVPFRKWFYSTVPCVVNTALKAVEKNKPRCYPSLKIRLAGLFVRCAPLWLLRLIMSTRPRKATPIT
ncbi:MAG: SDR family NAD(P)-dependent oxidoreductase [Akkermansia sp.]|nr:SDR family NAD(P)-dependent oxidoreductase [Akkermansia sp.]